MTATFTIGEIASRSGFAPSTLRYDDDLGLVRSSGRTAAGYRVDDERVAPEALGVVDELFGAPSVDLGRE